MKKSITRLRQWFNEGFWSVTTVPSLGSLAGQGSSLMGSLAQMNGQKEVVKTSLVTTCDVARSLCKPVDDLAGRTRAFSSYPSYGTYPKYAAPMTSPLIVDASSKSALMTAAKTVAAPSEAILAEVGDLANGM